MMLQRDLAENHKQIRMINGGSKNLDQISSMGQPAKKNWGLRYRGAEGTSEVHRKEQSYFVHEGTSKIGDKEVRQELRQDIRHNV